MTSKALRIIFFGPPGSGKGTQSDNLIRDFKLDHLSTGDALRAEIRAQSELGKCVKSIIEAGKLVDDATIMSIVEAALKRSNRNGFILDGIPRTINQAKVLDEILDRLEAPITHVPFLNISREVLEERVCGRLFHPGSGRVYHRTFNPPKKPMTDDITGEPLIVRKDDSKETFDARMKEYENTFRPVFDYYSKKGILHTIVGDKLTIPQIYDEVKAYILK